MQTTDGSSTPNVFETYVLRARLAPCLPIAIFLLVVTLWVVAERNSPIPQTSRGTPSAAQWRRTAAGWEDRRTWHAGASVRLPTLHPLAFAGLQIGGVLSLWAAGHASRSFAQVA